MTRHFKLALRLANLQLRTLQPPLGAIPLSSFDFSQLTKLSLHYTNNSQPWVVTSGFFILFTDLTIPSEISTAE